MTVTRRPASTRKTRFDMRLNCSPLAWIGLAILLSTNAHAEEQSPSGDVIRDQLARVIAVLRLQPSTAGQSCLDALHEVHQTEDQVKVLQNKTNNPDLALAQDVLETDYENAKEICGADAGRVCAGPGQVSGVAATCRALHQDGRSR